MKFFLWIPALGCSLCGTYIHQFRVDIVGGKGKKKRMKRSCYNNQEVSNV